MLTKLARSCQENPTTNFMLRFTLRLHVAVLLYCAVLSASAPTKPNIVLLLIDDIGWGDIDELIFDPPLSPAKQPNIRQWAAANTTVVFSRFYIGGSVCSPTRRYPCLSLDS